MKKMIITGLAAITIALGSGCGGNDSPAAVEDPTPIATAVPTYTATTVPTPIATAVPTYTATTVPTPIPNANEVQGDAKLEQRLNYFKDNSMVDDYNMNASIDCGGLIVEVDAAVIVEGSYKAIWYIGDEGNLSIQKAKLEEYGIPWSQIGACSVDSIEGKVDQIKDDNWAGGYY